MTERYRTLINDAMDIQAGSGICLGPSNLTGRIYQTLPIAVTVEGANILTRSMIIFGQGALRCHPWVLKEFAAAEMEDKPRSLIAFDQALFGHIGFLLRNLPSRPLSWLLRLLLFPSGYPYTEPDDRIGKAAARILLRPSAARDKRRKSWRRHFISTGSKWMPMPSRVACVLLASAEAVEKHDLPVLGRILDSQWAGLDPSLMGFGPVYAMAPLLKRHGLDSQDVDFWEISETFAAQVLACLKAWKDADFNTSQLGLETAFAGIPENRLNVDGGAISIGHPVGASGARIVLHLLKTLQREGSKTGIASLCIGGGQGGAMLVQNMG